VKVEEENKLGIIVTIEPHYFCKLNCIHCSSKGLEGYLRPTDIPDLPDNVDFIRIGGGEPFQNPVILNNMINKFSSHKIVMLTSGVIEIGGKLQSVYDIDKRVTRLEYSIYGREHIHNLITQRKSFLLTLDSLLKARDGGFNVSIRTITFNEENIKQSIEVAKTWDIPIYITKLIKHGEANKLPVPSKDTQISYIPKKIKYDKVTISCSLRNECDLNKKMCITPKGVFKCSADKWKMSNEEECCL
jgi:molybdenum cofactor biosynthesis enzyme MoaA